MNVIIVLYVRYRKSEEISKVTSVAVFGSWISVPNVMAGHAIVDKKNISVWMNMVDESKDIAIH